LHECISNSTSPKFGAILATTLEGASIAYPQAHTTKTQAPCAWMHLWNVPLLFAPKCSLKKKLKNKKGK
jgi:hypothetical protein